MVKCNSGRLAKLLVNNTTYRQKEHMTKFTIKLVFTDVDDNFFTKGQATMTFPVEADDVQTAYALGQRLQRNFMADNLIVKADE